MTKDNFSFKMEKTKYTHSNLHILVAGIFFKCPKKPDNDNDFFILPQAWDYALP